MCKNTMKLVVLVLDSYTPNSIRNSAIQKQTWVKDFEDSCDVLFYKAGKENKKLGYDLILDCSDTYSAMGVKTIKAFEWVHSNLDYDYIFRTNTSSYVDFRNLMKYLSKISKEERLYIAEKLYDLLESYRMSLISEYPRQKDSWQNLTKELKNITGREGKDLFMPLRRFLTGKSDGPDMKKLFPLIQKIQKSISS